MSHPSVLFCDIKLNKRDCKQNKWPQFLKAGAFLCRINVAKSLANGEGKNKANQKGSVGCLDAAPVLRMEKYNCEKNISGSLTNGNPCHYHLEYRFKQFLECKLNVSINIPPLNPLNSNVIWLEIMSVNLNYKIEETLKL